MKVTVAIPTYDGEAYIGEAVKSVLAQTFQDYELLVVDDRSSDGTLDIVRSFSDSRIRVVRNDERLGLPGNWNRCLSLAQGEFLTLFHQDDVMQPQNLEQKVERLTSGPDIVFVHSGAELLMEKSAPSAPVDWIEGSSEDFMLEGRLYFYKLLFRGNVVCAPTVLARRQRLLGLGGFDEDLGFTSDYEMWMKLCLEGKVSFISQPLIQYRWHAKNTSHAYRFERGVEESLVAGRRALKFFLEKTGQRNEAEILIGAATAIARHRRWTAELERAKIFLEEDRNNWKRSVDELEEQVKGQAKELQTAKSWLEGEVKNWQSKVGEQEKMIQEQKAWIHELETGKDWLAGQNEYWRKMVEETQTRIEMKILKLERRAAVIVGLLFFVLIFLNPVVLTFLGKLFGLGK